MVTFGAFVEIHPGVEGLVHISELAAHHVENPREVVNQGDVLAVRVIEIDADRRRLSLSLKRVADSDEIQHHLPDEIRLAPVIADPDEGAPFAAEPLDDGAEAPAAEEAPLDEEIAAEEMVAEGAPVDAAEAEEAPVEERSRPRGGWSRRRPPPRSVVEEAPAEELVEAAAEELLAQEAPEEELVVAEEAPAEELVAEETAATEAAAPPEEAEEPDAD